MSSSFGKSQDRMVFYKEMGQQPKMAMLTTSWEHFLNTQHNHCPVLASGKCITWWKVHFPLQRIVLPSVRGLIVWWFVCLMGEWSGYGKQGVRKSYLLGMMACKKPKGRRKESVSSRPNKCCMMFVSPSFPQWASFSAVPTGYLIFQWTSILKNYFYPLLLWQANKSVWISVFLGLS